MAQVLTERDGHTMIVTLNRPHRLNAMTMTMFAMLDDAWHEAADDDKVVSWVRDTWGAISEFGTGTTYINFAEEGESVVDEAFGAKLEKLAQIKAKYDPDNFFHRNNNIAPAA